LLLLPLRLASWAQAAFWAEEEDELEGDAAYRHFAAMVDRHVPKDAVAAKLLRDGEDDETVREREREINHT